MSLLVAGNAAVDLAHEVEALPRPGETLPARRKRVDDVGGKGLNQAVAAHRAGTATRLVAAVGDDAGGAAVRASLAAEGIARDNLVTIAAVPTDESVVLVADGGENLIVTTATAAAALPAEDVLAAIAAQGPGGFLLMQGNLPRALTEAALHAAKAAGLFTILNPAPVAFDHAGLLELVDLVVLNAVEAAALATVPCALTVVTEGPAGARLIRAGGTRRVPAPASAAVDSTGAGDVVCGVLAAGLEQGLAPEPALRWAMAAAAAKGARAGTLAALPGAAELRRLRPA